MYDRWTQFEKFPLFIDGILTVTQLDDKHRHWKADIGGIQEDREAEITEQIPDKLIAWKSTSEKELHENK